MLDVVSIGSATLDIFIPVPFQKNLPVGSKLKIGEAFVRGGGGAHNSAVLFKRNGLKAELIARVGDDVFGREIERRIRAERIKSQIIRDKGPSGVSYILLDGKGDQTILTQRGVSGSFTKEEFSDIPPSRWAYISTGAMQLGVVSHVVRMLHARGTRIAINPSAEMLAHGIKKIRPILNKCRVVLLNRKEASELTHTPLWNKRRIFKKLDADVLGVAIMTDGAKGAAVSDGVHILHTKALHVSRVADMTGAGDAFGSSFVAALIRTGEDCEKGVCKPDHLSYALRMGIENSAAVIGHVGATEGIKKGIL